MLNHCNSDRMWKVFDEQMVEEIINAYADAYEPPLPGSVLSGMYHIMYNVDICDNEFLYWFWVVAVLEGMVEDDEGYIDKDYTENMDALHKMFGLYNETYNFSTPEALAYARNKLIRASECFDLPRDLNIDEYTFMNKLSKGEDLWDEIEMANKEVDWMWTEIGKIEHIIDEDDDWYLGDRDAD